MGPATTRPNRRTHRILADYALVHFEELLCGRLVQVEELRCADLEPLLLDGGEDGARRPLPHRVRLDDGAGAVVERGCGAASAVDAPRAEDQVDGLDGPEGPGVRARAP